MKVFLQVTLIAQCAPGTTQTCLSLPATKYLNPRYLKVTPFLKQFFASLSIESWHVSKHVIFQHSTTTNNVAKSHPQIARVHIHQNHYTLQSREGHHNYSFWDIIPLFRVPYYPLLINHPIDDVSTVWTRLSVVESVSLPKQTHGARAYWTHDLENNSSL